MVRRKNIQRYKQKGEGDFEWFLQLIQKRPKEGLTDEFPYAMIAPDGRIAS